MFKIATVKTEIKS